MIISEMQSANAIIINAITVHDGLQRRVIMLCIRFNCMINNAAIRLCLCCACWCSGQMQCCAAAAAWCLVHGADAAQQRPAATTTVDAVGAVLRVRQRRQCCAAIA